MTSPPPSARFWGRWAALALVSLLVVPPVVCEIAGWPFLARPAETLLTRAMGREVRIDPPFRMHLYGRLRLEAGGLWIAAPAGFAEPHFVSAHGLRLEMRYPDLFALRHKAPLHIAALTVDAIDARLVRHPDGSTTWQMGEDTGGPLPTVDRLQVRAGGLVLDDPLANLRLAGTFDTDEGSAAGTPASHAHLEGTLRDRPLTARLAAGGWLPLAGGAPEPLAARIRVTYGGITGEFNGEVRDLFGRQTLAGAVTVSGRSLAVLGRLIGAPLPTSGRFALAGHLVRRDARWEARVDSARIGSSRLAGRFVFDAASTPPRLTGELTGKRLALADLAPAFGTRDAEGRSVAPPPGRAIPDRPLDLPALRNLDAHLAVALDELDPGSAFRERLRPLKAALTLSEGKLALSEITARTARGSLNGAISVDAAPAIPHWRADLAWDGIRLEQWLKAATARPARAGRATPPYFTGTLRGRADLHARGRSLATVLASLGGDATVAVADGTMSHLLVEILGLDIAQGLGLLMRGDESLPVTCATLQLAVNDGRATPTVALLDTPVTLVLGEGSVDLGKERLDLRVMARPRNMSPLTLRSPIRVQGSFLEPRAAPVGGPIAARVLGSLALATVNPLAALIPYLDPGSTDAPTCAQSLARLKRG